MQKLVFVLFRRADVTHEQAMAEWSGERHVAVVRSLPGLRGWVQNHPLAPPAEGAADGTGELWFESAEAMEAALTSPEMAAAFEDSKRFLDMERTYGFPVEEKALVSLEDA